MREMTSYENMLARHATNLCLKWKWYPSSLCCIWWKYFCDEITWLTNEITGGSSWKSHILSYRRHASSSSYLQFPLQNTEQKQHVVTGEVLVFASALLLPVTPGNRAFGVLNWVDGKLRAVRLGIASFPGSLCTAFTQRMHFYKVHNNVKLFKIAVKKKKQLGIWATDERG